MHTLVLVLVTISIGADDCYGADGDDVAVLLSDGAVCEIAMD